MGRYVIVTSAAARKSGVRSLRCNPWTAACRSAAQILLKCRRYQVRLEYRGGVF